MIFKGGYDFGALIKGHFGTLVLALEPRLAAMIKTLGELINCDYCTVHLISQEKHFY